jgi:hypothetical protein
VDLGTGMTNDTIRDRIASVCAGTDFGFTRAQTPFSFELQPSGSIDEVFRIETEANQVIGGFNYSEERTDLMHIWLARKHHADPEVTYDQLLIDATSLRAAIIRDGCQDSGEYSIPAQGAEATIAREPKSEFAVLRLTVPVNYETTV